MTSHELFSNTHAPWTDREVQAHLDAADTKNLGSFYTPAKYVALAYQWLSTIDELSKYTILDPSCGYGAFFALQGQLNNPFIGNDIDPYAIDMVKRRFPQVQTFQINKFYSDRQSFGLGENGPCIIVGNPPYNDTTSQINASIKTSRMDMPKDIATRDLGMSSLKLYNKFKADYVLILHPLSYLIKKSNFNVCQSFFSHYEIQKNIVFTSQEFARTSRLSEFPILMALYKRLNAPQITYSDIEQWRFHLENGASFSLSDYEFITDHIDKYPSKRVQETPYIFYTLRDINALRRSRTFVTTYGSNCLYIRPDKLPYYCYIDCFKEYCATHPLPFWLGNFNVPFKENTFPSIQKDVLQWAKHRHPEVFGPSDKPGKDVVERIWNYMSDVVDSYKGGCGEHCCGK